MSSKVIPLDESRRKKPEASELLPTERDPSSQWPLQVDLVWQEQMINQYIPLVKYIARQTIRRMPLHISSDDLISSGILGLIDAIHKFNPSKNINFKTYAEFRIKGAILDELRELDWAPRSVRKKEHLLENTYVALEKTLGRPAEPEEMSSALNLELEEFYRLLDETKTVFLLGLDGIWQAIDNRPESKKDNSLETFYVQSDDDPFLAVQLSEIHSAFARSLPILPFESQLLLSLYYGEELTMREIAHVMKCTESRVSQLHTEALLQLKPVLEKELGIENISPDINSISPYPDRHRGKCVRNKSLTKILPKTLNWHTPSKMKIGSPEIKSRRRKLLEKFYIPDFILVGLPYKSQYPKDLLEQSKQFPLLLPFDWERATSQFGKMRLQRIGKLVKNRWIKKLANSASTSVEALTILLDGRQVDVLYYYYLKNMTQEEVGEKIGISASQVSRILTKAKENLQ